MTENFEKTAQELEKLNKEFVIKGVPEGHEKIWVPNNEVRLWQVPRRTAELLKFLVLANKAKTVLELGTSAGYSAIWLAAGVKQTGGKVYTMELFEPKIKMAKENFEKAGVAEHVCQIQGEISEELDKWNQPVDFLFMDADKPNYLKYIKQVMLYLKPGAVIVADNAVDFAEYMQDFLEFIKQSKEFEGTVLDIDNGLLVAIKKG